MNKSICSYCKSKNNKLLWKKQNFEIFRCQHCGLVFTNLPKSHKVNEFNKNYYANEYLVKYESRRKNLSDRFTKRLHEIERIKSGGKLLDVGCSTGLFLRTVETNASHAWTLFGIDINKKSIQVAKKLSSAIFVNGSLQSKKFTNNFFDCVTCFDVLEHDKNINGNLKEIRRILKPGGLLIIQCPNYRSAMAYFARQEWDWWSIPDHVIHFSPEVMTNILINNKFTVIKKFTWEEQSEFVKNIQGSLKKRLPSFLFMNKIIAKISSLPLSLLWSVVHILEKFFDIGALTVIYAVKN